MTITRARIERRMPKKGQVHTHVNCVVRVVTCAEIAQSGTQ